MKYISLNIILLFGCLYHIFSSRIASNVNPFVSAIVTYLSALLLNIVLFVVIGKCNLMDELQKVNKYSIFLGLTIGMYDLGYVLAYRSGWLPVKLQPLTLIGITTLTVLISIVVYKQKIDVANIVGLVLLVTGIILVLK